MKNLKTVLLALLVCSLSMACKKVSMPPKPTQTGANTIYAKVNGKPWQKAACWSCIGGSGLRRNYDDRTYFNITGENPKDGNSTITIVIPNLKIMGQYELSAQSLNYARFNRYNPETQRFYTSVTNKGKVTITKLDMTNKILSGTFEFSAEDENNPANTIKVSDGWFDITFN